MFKTKSGATETGAHMKTVVITIIDRYRVSCYKLGTLQALFDMEHVNQFLKMIGRIGKEDCAIDLRYKMFIYV